MSYELQDRARALAATDDAVLFLNWEMTKWIIARRQHQT
jgi:hypothetical protein